MSKPEPSQIEAVLNVNRVRRILEAAKLLNSTIDLTELTGIILKIVREEVGIDRGTVFLIDREKQELRSIVAQGVDRPGIRLPFGSGVAGAVAATGEIIDIADAYADSRFNQSVDAALQYRTKDIFSMPISNREGQTVGVLELLNRKAPFQQDDLEFLGSVSVHIGLALENAWLHRQLLEKRKMEQELLLARNIQQNLYPLLPRSSCGVEMAASSTMCDAVGGDYLDYFKLKDGRFIIMLGDVSGKGIGAALVMTALHATCRALLRNVESLDRIAMILNESLLETTRAQTYVTLVALLMDPDAKQMHCVRAGHLPPLLVNDEGKAEWLERGGGLPIGLFSNLTISIETYSFTPGSIVVLYTDGVTEAEGLNGEHFGMGRLNSAVTAHRQDTAVIIHEAIRAGLREFTENRKATDDSTLVVLKV
jgi:sigma-B regulation protein RsbU (phosphoserine phosphatase)